MTVVAAVGPGYVGLPLAVEFGKRHETIGFDLLEQKIANYRKFFDPTREVYSEDLEAAKMLSFTTEASDIQEAGFIVKSRGRC